MVILHLSLILTLHNQPSHTPPPPQHCSVLSTMNHFQVDSLWTVSQLLECLADISVWVKNNWLKPNLDEFNIMVFGYRNFERSIFWSPCYSWSKTVPCDTELKVRNQSDYFLTVEWKIALAKTGISKFCFFLYLVLTWLKVLKAMKNNYFYFFLLVDKYYRMLNGH